VSEPIYVSRSRVEKGPGFRRVYIEAGPIIECGVHGPVKKHYKLDHLPDLPLPVDYLAASTGA
jgi:hypothetical protein